MGSIALAQQPKGVFEVNNFYAISKAAVNMGMRRFSAWTRDRGIRVAILGPGAVRTKMYAETGAELSRANPPDVVITALIDYLETMTIEQTGTFRSFSGQTVPW